jgi:hypothetical protein
MFGTPQSATFKVNDTLSEELEAHLNKYSQEGWNLAAAPTLMPDGTWVTIWMRFPTTANFLSQGSIIAEGNAPKF